MVKIGTESGAHFAASNSGHLVQIQIGSQTLNGKDRWESERDKGANWYKSGAHFDFVGGIAALSLLSILRE